MISAKSVVYKDGLQNDKHKQVPHLFTNSSAVSSVESIDDQLVEYSALFRACRQVTFTIDQRSYLMER
jgi:hypothetical protein